MSATPSFIPVDVADISAAWLQEVLLQYAPEIGGASCGEKA